MDKMKMPADALQILRTYFDQLAELSEDAWADFEAVVKYGVFNKGERLITLTEPCERVYFVLDGLARHYFLDDRGRQTTTWFNEAGSLITDYAAFTMQQKPMFEVQAVITTKVCWLQRTDLETLYDRYKAWERIGRLGNQIYLALLVERNNTMFTKTARQRYQDLLSERGHLFNLVPLKHLATYLGISLETLSRLRSDTY